LDKLLDGRMLSQKIKDEIKAEIQELEIKPSLAVVLVGDDPASHTYVSMKQKACEYVGIDSLSYQLDKNSSEEEIVSQIIELNNNHEIDGILIQLPLPEHINTEKILELVSPEKDVDGFHPFNVGALTSNLNKNNRFVPCTPVGVMEIFKEYNIELQGKNAVVVGASNIVGKPMASLLLNANATVTVCHIYTKDLKQHTLNADILVVAVGKPNLITADMVKDDAIVIDVGINKLADDSIVGDVAFDEVSKKSQFITPVPGGVGPMTIAMLLSNTLKSAKERRLKN
jgi:methylenetetrahydrofolate dehydrogenase (NADP+)/methenyltetrahydrofolate cyclohydrolase